MDSVLLEKNFSAFKKLLCSLWRAKVSSELLEAHWEPVSESGEREPYTSLGEY